MDMKFGYVIWIIGLYIVDVFWFVLDMNLDHSRLKKNDRKNGFKELDLQNGYGNWIFRDVDWIWKMGPRIWFNMAQQRSSNNSKKRMSRLIWN